MQQHLELQSGICALMESTGLPKPEMNTEMEKDKALRAWGWKSRLRQSGVRADGRVE
jgi:hypothetical protein